MFTENWISIEFVVIISIPPIDELKQWKENRNDLQIIDQQSVLFKE